MDGFHVDVDSLDAAATGIARSVQDQQTVDLRRLPAGPGRYGHEGLRSALVEFCDSWGTGLDILTEDARAVGDTLFKAAQIYRAVDEAGARSWGSDPGIGAVDD